MECMRLSASSPFICSLKTCQRYSASSQSFTISLNNYPHVQRAVFWLPCKGLYRTATLKGLVMSDNRALHYGLPLKGVHILLLAQIV